MSAVEVMGDSRRRLPPPAVRVVVLMGVGRA